MSAQTGISVYNGGKKRINLAFSEYKLLQRVVSNNKADELEELSNIFLELEHIVRDVFSVEKNW